jgi:hypothetical protein
MSATPVLNSSSNHAPLTTEAVLCEYLRAFGVSLRCVATEHGVILEGVAATYYGKQMAQELARKARLVVRANRIQVVRV